MDTTIHAVAKEIVDIIDEMEGLGSVQATKLEEDIVIVLIRRKARFG